MSGAIEEAHSTRTPGGACTNHPAVNSEWANVAIEATKRGDARGRVITDPMAGCGGLTLRDRFVGEAHT